MFHVLDNVTLFDRESRRARNGQGSFQFSSFGWNDVLFRSFQAGNLKSLDFEFFKQLDSAIAKRLYRFLDKRFFHRSRYEFNLKELCWEHVGLSRNYDATDLKRKLRPGILELELAGFLEPLGDTERFRKVSCGDWRVVFAKASGKRVEPKPSPALGGLAAALTERGVTASSARSLCAEFPEERIRSQLEVFDWLVAQKDKRLARNPAGFLVSSIRSEYAPPRSFVSQAEQAKRAVAAAERARKAEVRAQRLTDQEQARFQARARAVAGFWDSLSAEERSRLETEAMAAAQPSEHRLLGQGGLIAQTIRQNLLDVYALQCLQAGAV